MKLKLYNGTNTSTTLNITGGGYDPELGRVVLIVQGEHGQAGTLQLDPTEAARIAAILTNGLPKIERVSPTASGGAGMPLPELPISTS